jgi:hypothetical protein
MVGSWMKVMLLTSFVSARCGTSLADLRKLRKKGDRE